MLTLASFGGIFLPALPVCAAERFTHHEDIRQQVRNFLASQTELKGYQDVSIEIGRIDSRLKLASCDTDLEVVAGTLRLPGNVSLAVQCNTGKPWKIYLQATVNAYQMIYVARVPISRGTAISINDLLLQKENITSLNGNFLSDPKSIQGLMTKRAIRKGEIIHPRILVKSKLIKRGEQVTVIAETAGISVRMSGKAMNDATAGQQVRVKNNNSERIVEGVAINRGVVKVNM